MNRGVPRNRAMLSEILPERVLVELRPADEPAARLQRGVQAVSHGSPPGA